MSHVIFIPLPRSVRLGYWWSLYCIGIILLLRDVRAQLNNETSPTHQFKSRPDLHAPIIETLLLKPELVDPGYIFIAPYRNIDPGPYIYDNAGNLVWSGAGHSGPRVAHTPRVCQYHGEDHLCFFTGEQHQGFSRGHGVIMDKHYRTVRTIEAHGAGATCDMHEFKMTPFSDGKSVLMTVYQPRQYDLTTNPRFNVKGGMGWIVEGVFQEIEIDTGRLLFEWRSLDHVDPGDAWTMPHTTDTSGDGLNEQSPWDYFHINSIDKNIDGDYLISARHTSAIYKLSGKDGSIIWTLGGVKSDFETTNFHFAYQHHARWISETKNRTVFSFFDNGSNGFNHSAEYSHGWIVEIDHLSNKATMLHEWGAPDDRGGLRAGSQGSMQVLPSGNVHIGWGEWAFYSEHTADGRPAMYAKVASRPSNVMIYRTNKYNWTAQPLTKPALWTYSKFGSETRSGKMMFYVSWNGATEVRSWNFYVADSASGPWTLVANQRKSGFETVHAAKFYRVWAYAQALDADGRVLEDSVIARTFVPSAELRKHCGDAHCEKSVAIKKEDQGHTPVEAHVDVDQKFLSTNRGFDTTNYYHDDERYLGYGHGNETTQQQLQPPYERPHTADANGKVHPFPLSGRPQADSHSGHGGGSLFILVIGMVTGYVASIFLHLVRGKGTSRFGGDGGLRRVLGLRRRSRAWDKESNGSLSKMVI